MQFLDSEPVSCLGCLERQQPEEFYDGVFEGIEGYRSRAGVGYAPTAMAVSRSGGPDFTRRARSVRLAPSVTEVGPAMGARRFSPVCERKASAALDGALAAAL